MRLQRWQKVLSGFLFSLTLFLLLIAGAYSAALKGYLPQPLWSSLPLHTSAMHRLDAACLTVHNPLPWTWQAEDAGAPSPWVHLQENGRPLRALGTGRRDLCDLEPGEFTLWKETIYLRPFTTASLAGADTAFTLSTPPPLLLSRVASRRASALANLLALLSVAWVIALFQVNHDLSGWIVRRLQRITPRLPLLRLDTLDRFLLPITLIAFVASLLALWHKGTYDGRVIAGLFPFSDARIYYWEALRLDYGQAFSQLASRRPVFAALSAFLLAITTQNLQLTLLILCVIAALACYFLADEVRAIFGPAAAWMLLLLLYLCYTGYGYVGRLLTENLGLSLGALGLALLLRGARVATATSTAQAKSLSWLCLGAFVLSLGLNTRAGAFFTLPALVLWIWRMDNRERRQRRILRAAALSAAMAAGFAANLLLIHFLGSAEGTPFGNFGSVLYGLASGYQGWEKVYLDYPGISDDQALALAWDLIATQPGRFLYGILRSYLDFFNPSVMFQFLHFPGISQIIASRVLFLSSVLGVGRLLARRSHAVASLALLLGMGILASVALVPPVDDGMRALTVTMPVSGLIAASAFANMKKIDTSAGESLGGVKPLLGFTLSLIACCIAAPLILKGIAHPPSGIPILRCPAGEEAVTIAVSEGSYLRIAEDSALPISLVPWLRQADLFASLPKGNSFGFPELDAYLGSLHAGETVFFTLNLQDFKQQEAGDPSVGFPIWISLPDERLRPEDGRLNLCARPSANGWLRSFRFYEVGK